MKPESSSMTSERAEDNFSLAVVACERSEWVERVVTRRDEFGVGLAETGVPDELVKRDIAAYDSEVMPILQRPSFADPGSGTQGWWGSNPDAYEEVSREEHEKKYRDAVSAVRRVLGMRRMRVLERTVQQVNLPLFVLASPPVPGSRVTFTEAQMAYVMGGWTINVFGTGAGADVKVRLQSSGSFVAQEGARKRVFLPAKVAVSRIGVYEGRRKVGEGRRVEVEEANENAVVEVIDADEGVELDDASLAMRYPLSGDPSGDVATYELEAAFAMKTDLEIGIDAFKVKAKLRAEIYRERTATLKFELPSGHDYEFRYSKSPSGVWCVAPTAPPR
jgi:hypothetical protein